MRWSQLIRILWAHRWTSLCILAAVLAVAVAASLLLPKKYKAESAIVVDVRGSDPLTPQDAMPAQLASTYLATQADVIASHNVALKVMDRMKLANDPKFIEKFRDAEPTPEIGAIRDWGADELLKHLKVRPSRDSNVIYMQFTGNSPQAAADIANAFADCYLQTSLELKVDPARRQAGWFDEQVNDLRIAFENAQHKLSAYQSEHEVIGTDDARLDVENARLTEIANHLVTAQTAMFDAQTRQRQMKDALAKDLADASVNVLGNPLLQNLKTELARSEAKLANVAQRYDRNHPQYMSAQAELESLRRKVETEVDNANENVSREAQIARQNTADLQLAMEQQRKRILALQHTQDEFLVLKRDAENARAAYDSALQHGSQTRLESRLDHTTIAILNYAFPPLDPAWPLLLLNLALALILGSMLGAGVSLIREGLDRRIRSRDDLLEGADIAVLAELPRVHALPRKRRVALAAIDKQPRAEPA
jgi:succinoglycan biosynthesis transport protein ExoP